MFNYNACAPMGGDPGTGPILPCPQVAEGSCGQKGPGKSSSTDKPVLSAQQLGLLNAALKIAQQWVQQSSACNQALANTGAANVSSLGAILNDVNADQNTFSGIGSSYSITVNGTQTTVGQYFRW